MQPNAGTTNLSDVSGPQTQLATAALPAPPPLKPAKTLSTLSARTQRAYAADLAAFTAWCRSADRVSLPAAAETLVLYAAACAKTLSRSAVDRRLAAIAAAHVARGLAMPDDPASRALLRHAKRSASRKPRHPRLGPAQLAALAQHCPRDLAGLRDRALLLLAGATWLDRKALLAIDAEDVAFGASGAVIVVRDPRRAGLASRFTLARTPLPSPCAVQALEDWLRASESYVGPVFRAVDKGGSIQFGRLSEEAFRLIVRRQTLRRRGMPAPAGAPATRGMPAPAGAPAPPDTAGLTRGPVEALLVDAPPDMSPPSRQRDRAGG